MKDDQNGPCTGPSADAEPEVFGIVELDRAPDVSRRKFVKDVLAALGVAAAASVTTSCEEYDVKRDGETCICHVVCTSDQGHSSSWDSTYGGGVCVCDLVCTCNTVCTCDSEGGGGGGGHYWYPS